MDMLNAPKLFERESNEPIFDFSTEHSEVFKKLLQSDAMQIIEYLEKEKAARLKAECLDRRISIATLVFAILAVVATIAVPILIAIWPFA